MGWADALGSIGGSLIGGAASLYGGSLAADAAKNAGQAQMAQYYQNRRDMLPWLQTGQAGVNAMRDILLRGGSSDYLETPGYDFRMGEGVKAIDRSASARGMMGSGATLKALQEYGQNIGTEEYNQRLNRLGVLAGYGQNAAGSIGGWGSNAAAGYGNALAQAGAIRGSSFNNAANVLGQGIGNALYNYHAY
jgi:hypothetical protein